MILGISMVTAACVVNSDIPTPPPSSKLDSTSSSTIPLTRLNVEHYFTNLSFHGMVAIGYPDDGTNRLFVALQTGKIMVFQNHHETTSPLTFLDIRERVSDRGKEEGLLGLAFDPKYRTNGHFYIYYSASNPRRSIISRFSTSGPRFNQADPDSERIILEVPQPFTNHNGGQIIFGPDGYLYIGLGDGGSSNDPHQNGQNASTLLGSILRIDVNSFDEHGTYTIPSDNPFSGQSGSVRKEIWAYGLRNPWRFTFDRITGMLWAGDVGQDKFEEINIIKPGLNYGWNTMEGFVCSQPREACNQNSLETPIIAYSQNDGCSVIGGYVYRNYRIPSLYGAYIYGDFCSGKIWAIRHNGSNITEHMEIVDSNLQISSFAEDQSGEIFILSFDNKIYRLNPL